MQLHYPLNPATGVEDPTQLPWQNGVPATGTEGSYPPYQAVVDPMIEAVNVITAAGITPSEVDLKQLTRATRSGILEYYIDTGTASVVIVATGNSGPAHTALVDGLHLRIKMKYPPAGPTTIALDGIAAANLKRRGNLALIGGEWNANDVIDVVYSATASAFLICGLTPSDVSNTVISSITSNLDGCVRLSVASATSLVLNEYNGQYIIINGSPQLIPLSGVTVSNSGLAASTLYYAYLQMVGGVMTLNLSTTGTMLNSAGQRVKSGDATQRMVGMIYTNTSAQFADSTLFRGVANYFNRTTKFLNGNVSVASTGSVTPVPLANSGTVTFLSWSDEGTQTWILGTGSGGAGIGYAASCGIDGVSGGNSPSNYSASGGQNGPALGSVGTQLTEGVHTATPFGATSQAGSNANFIVNTTV